MKRRSSRESSANHDERSAKVQKRDDAMEIDSPATKTATAEQVAEPTDPIAKPAEPTEPIAKPVEPVEQPKPMLTRKTSGGKPPPIMELPPQRRTHHEQPTITPKQQKKLEEK